MNKRLKKAAIVVTIILMLILVDFVKYSTAEILLNNISPEIVPGDSSVAVTITVYAQTKTGKPLVGHDLYALTLGGGSWLNYYSRTDEDGKAQFVYFPYDLPEYQNPRDVEIKIRDESNSIFVEMYPSVSFKVKIVRPDEVQNGGDVVDGFFD